MTTVPGNQPGGGGVFVSIGDIYQETVSTRDAVRVLQTTVTNVEKDVAEVQADVSAIKARQWPPFATSILGGSVVAVVAAILGVVVK